MRPVPFSEIQALEPKSQVVRRMRNDPKVLLHEDGRVFKVVRSKIRLRLSGFGRRSKRFAVNCRRLAAREIDCPKLLEILRVTDRDLHVVVYEPLAGRTAREIFAETDDCSPMALRLARYVALLHDRGVYFAGGHTDNYIVQPNGEFGIIDIQDSWVLPMPLNAIHRALSFRILLKYPEDRAALSVDGRLKPFVDTYLDATRLGRIGRYLFMTTLRLRLPELYQQL
ncbi:MAG: hypothetical protein P8N09_05130 [Planctomycetota bacterium]|jgi:hypothetical protein|nr:hypothetical protein [Planctomycetota bacterium]